MIEIKIPVTANLLQSIALDLKHSEKAENFSEPPPRPAEFSMSLETQCFLRDVLKTSLYECERLQVEVDSIIDAGTEAASILAR